MGLPFNIVQGLVQIMDSAGNLVETVLSGGKRRLTTQSVITGGNAPYRDVDVILGQDNKNRACVDAIFNQENQAQYITSNYRLIANNTSTNILRSATYTSQFSYSGSGFFFGFHLNQKETSTQFRIVIDGVVIFTDISISFIKDLRFIVGTSVPAQFQNKQLFVTTNNNDIDFSFPIPMKFNTSFEVLARNTSTNWTRTAFFYHYQGNT